MRSHSRSSAIRIIQLINPLENIEALSRGANVGGGGREQEKDGAGTRGRERGERERSERERKSERRPERGYEAKQKRVDRGAENGGGRGYSG